MNKNSGYGLQLSMQIAAAVGPVLGRIHVVVNDSDPSVNRDNLRALFDPDNLGHLRFFSTIDAAYAACTSDADDVILMAGDTTHTVTTPWTWSKNRIHVIGMDGGHRAIQQGAKIDYSGSGAYVATLYVTGTRNSFINLKVSSSGTGAANIAAMIDEGEGTLIKNCSFVKLTDLDQTTVADFICHGDSFTYDNVEFGLDTLVQTAVRPTFWVNGTAAAGTRMKNGRIKNCRFISASTSASKVIFKCAASSFLFSTIVEDCVFVNSINATQAAIQATVAAESDATNTEGVIIFTNVKTNSASFATTSTGFVVVAPAASNNGFEGVTPA